MHLIWVDCLYRLCSVSCDMLHRQTLRILWMSGLLSILVFTVYGQSHTWYFTDQTSMTIDGSGEASFDTIDNPNLYEPYRSIFSRIAMIHDEDGGVLFYSDGKHVYDKYHHIMTNGDSIGGDGQLEQSVIICPFPNSDSLYYVFTVGKTLDRYIDLQDDTTYQNKLRYSVVDISLNNNLGAVVEGQKNIFLKTGADLGMVSIPGSCEDIWLVTVDNDGISTYHITDHGISPQYLDQYKMELSGRDATFRLMLTSPKGRYIILHDRLIEAFIEVYEFDRHTGLVVLIGELFSDPPKPEPLTKHMPIIIMDYYGKYLYADEGFKEGLTQYDLSSNDIETIKSSRKIVSHYDDDQGIVDMQISSHDSSVIQVMSPYDSLSVILNSDTDNPTYIKKHKSKHINGYSKFPMLTSYPIATYPLKESISLSSEPDCDHRFTTYEVSDQYSGELYIDGLLVDSLVFYESGTYEVELVTECEVLDTLLHVAEYSASCDCHVYLPNAIHPGSTRGNAAFQPISNCAWSLYDLQVYDRWGSVVYSSSNPNESWNGERNNQLLSGVYTYQFSYQFDGLDPEMCTGTVSILR